MALLEVVVELGQTCGAAHVHHGLRGEAADGDEEFVRRRCGELGVPFFGARVDASRPPRPDGRSPEARARELRYAALERVRERNGYAHVLTAHTLDDQAETVLLRVFRGSGPDGLGGIPERSSDGVVVRPLLRVSRPEIEAYAAQRGFSWREDSSNRSVAYARNRLRLRWLPGLAGDFNEQLLMAVGNLAEAQRRDSEWIGALVEREAAARFRSENGWLRTRAEGWDELPEALARRLARWGLRRCGGERDATRVHLERMLAFLRTARSGTQLELPGGTRLERDRDGFRLGPIEPAGRGGCR